MGGGEALAFETANGGLVQGVEGFPSRETISFMDKEGV